MMLSELLRKFSKANPLCSSHPGAQGAQEEASVSGPAGPAHPSNSDLPCRWGRRHIRHSEKGAG